MQLTHFKTYTKQDILSFTRLRRFKTKIGERVSVLNSSPDFSTAIKQSTARYILIGIPEDIGVQANGGKPGTGSVWQPFIHAFLNTQSNDFLEGGEIAVAGYFDFSDLENVINKNAPASEEKTEAYRHAVTKIDEEVEGLI